MTTVRAVFSKAQSAKLKSGIITNYYNIFNVEFVKIHKLNNGAARKIHVCFWQQIQYIILFAKERLKLLA